MLFSILRIRPSILVNRLSIASIRLLNWVFIASIFVATVLRLSLAGSAAFCASRALFLYKSATCSGVILFSEVNICSEVSVLS